MKIKNNVDISIVILCFRSNESIIPFIGKVKSELTVGNISNYELILVANYFENDSDKTPKIVKALARNDDRIKVISEKKGGMMDNYIEEIGQSPIRYKELNGWSLNQYRELWNRFDTKFKRIKYIEWSWLQNLDLVRQYPECFRGRVDHFDDLFVQSIRVLFQKAPIV